jgi:hypothetical protein
VDVSYPGPGLQSAIRRRRDFHAAKVSMRDRIGRHRTRLCGCMMIPDVLNEQRVRCATQLIIARGTHGSVSKTLKSSEYLRISVIKTV